MILDEGLNIGIKVILMKDFPLVCETLERMGVINHKEKKIFPSCYCMETTEKLDDGKKVYTITHFKELFVAQGKPSNFDDLDKIRLNTIAYLLNDWGMVKVLDPTDIEEISKRKIPTLPHHKKPEYKIVHKFRHRRD